MSGFPTELRDSLILFFLLLGLLQLYYLFTTLLPFFNTYYPYGFIAHASFYAAEFIVLYLYVKAVKRIPFSDLGFRRLSRWKAHCALGFTFAIFHNAIELAFSSIVLGIEHGYALPIHIYIPVYFAFYLLISVSEEGVFRGCILGGLLQRFGDTASIIFSSTLFGLYHISYYYLLFFGASGVIMVTSTVFHSFTAGLFLACFYHRADGNLIGPVSYHFSQMFFNVPYLWMGTPPGVQTPSLLFQFAPTLFPSALNVIQTLMIRRIRLRD